MKQTERADTLDNAAFVASSPENEAEALLEERRTRHKAFIGDQYPTLAPSLGKDSRNEDTGDALVQKIKGHIYQKTAPVGKPASAPGNEVS